MKKIFLGLFSLGFVFLVSCSVFIKDNTKKKLADDMVFVPAGEFVAGSSEILKFKREDTVSPLVAHLNEKKVFLDSFYLGKAEITNKEYYEFIKDGGYEKKRYWSDRGWGYINRYKYFLPRYWKEGSSSVADVRYTSINLHTGLNYPEYPALGTSWYEAEAYARWRGMSLPSEMEWEKAARGTDGRFYPWGNDFDKFKCNSMETKMGLAVLGDSFMGGASPYGVLNMCGNLYEWTSTLFEDQEYDLPAVNGERDWKGEIVVIKGGCYDDPGAAIKTFARFISPANERERGRHTGIRLAVR